MIEETSINDRVIQVMKLKNMSPSQFADITRINRATISQLTANRNNPSFSTIMSILETFPEIDANWLLLGRKSVAQNIDNQENVNSTQLHQLDIFNNQQSENQTVNNIPVQDIKNEHIFTEGKTESKKIEKIVVFYTDKSFSEYKPE